MPSKLAAVMRPARQVLGALTGELCEIDGMAGTFYIVFEEETTAGELGAHGSDETIEVRARFSRSDFQNPPPFGATLIRDGTMRYKIGPSGNGPNSWQTTLVRIDRTTPSHDDNQYPI